MGWGFLLCPDASFSFGGLYTLGARRSLHLRLDPSHGCSLFVICELRLVIYGAAVLQSSKIHVVQFVDEVVELVFLFGLSTFLTFGDSNTGAHRVAAGEHQLFVAFRDGDVCSRLALVRGTEQSGKIDL